MKRKKKKSLLKIKTFAWYKTKTKKKKGKEKKKTAELRMQGRTAQGSLSAAVHGVRESRPGPTD